MSALFLSPSDNNYLTSRLVNQQLLQNPLACTITTNVTADPLPAVLTDGAGRCYLQGFVTINNGSPTTGMALLNLPAQLVPNVDQYFPVTVLRSGAYVSNAIKLSSLGKSLTGVIINSPGSYATYPSLVLTGPGVGATFTSTMKVVSATDVAAGTGYAPGDAITLTGGTETTNAVLGVVTTKLISSVVNAPGNGYTQGDTITLAGGVFAAQAVLTVTTTQITSLSLNARGSGYAPNNTITLAGGTAGTAGVVTVNTTKVVNVSINTGGSGGTNGTQTVTGTTGTGAMFQLSVTVAGGAITAIISVINAGSYTVNPTTITNEPVTGAGLSGASVSVLMGLNTATVTTAGSYTVNSATFTQASTSGSGTGATFASATFGVKNFTVTNAGNYSTNATTFTQASSSGSGTGATFNTNSYGVLTITVNNGGSYTVLPSNPVAQGSTTGSGTGATFTPLYGFNSIAVSTGGTGYGFESHLETSGGGEVVPADLSLQLSSETGGVMTLINAPTNGDIINLSSVQFIVNPY